MLTSTCICGDVSFEVHAPLARIRHCHCSACRKTHGTAFASFGSVPGDSLRFIRGENQLKGYASSPELTRYFCERCGSSPLVRHNGDDRAVVAAGPLQGEVRLRPSAHIFAASKAVWYEITDGLPEYEGYPERPDFAVASQPRHHHAGEGAAGSCQCARVSYEYDGTPQFMWYCHCSRCRRARAAAHASNVFVKRENFRWLSGEDKISFFKLPEAERFSQAFCTVCGSAVPRARDDFPLVVIPAGSLDDDPKARSAGHIFVGSRASWYEPSGSLPQFEEMAR